MRFDLSKEETDLILDAMGSHYEIHDSDKSQWFPASALYWKLLDTRAAHNMAGWIDKETAD